MLKVMTIVGTRPEIIRLSRIIEKLDRHCAHVLVHTGQNYDYELNELFFRELNIRQPDCFLSVAGATGAETIGKIIIAADGALAQHQPDAILILEINRRIVDHIADINLTYSDIARDYLLREGLPADQIIKTGSPLREVIEHYWAKVEASDVLSSLDVVQYGYLVVSLHREENVDDPGNLQRLLGLLSHLADKYDQPVVVSTHPRTRGRVDALGVPVHKRVLLHKPFGFLDYLKLQVNARAVLSDSGTITEESSILNIPALNLREVHERPEGFEEASVMLVGLDRDRVDQALDVLSEQPRGSERLLRMVRDYEPTNVSDKVVRIILSYTDYVRRRVWRLE
jgi:UDP-N-acetylglucosamine 2-epimerase